MIVPNQDIDQCKNEKTKHQLCDIISDMKSLENCYFNNRH